MKLTKFKILLFLKEVFFLGISAFGGPQAHLSMFFRQLVSDKKYLTEKELLELNALCSILPGPTSTQTLTAIGFKLGGPKVAYLTLLIWSLPAVIVMTGLGVFITFLQDSQMSLDFTRFIQPMAVGFIAYAAWKISFKIVKTKFAFVIMILSAIASFFAQSPYAFPIILLLGGLVSTLVNKDRFVAEKDKEKLIIKWENFLLWIGLLVLMAILGFLTKEWIWVSKPIRIFENFYRNGSLIFGGGQVLIPLLLTEFSIEKKYLSEEEFRIGFAFMQALPGPVFAFSAYIGSMSMKDYGLIGQVTGGFMASLGIFLPGTFLIFFVIRIWNKIKKLKIIKASLEGVNAGASGMVLAAAIILFMPLANSLLNVGIVVLTFCLLQFTRIYAPIIVITGIALGLIL